MHGNPRCSEWRAGVDPKNLVPLGPRGARFVRPPDAVRVVRSPDGPGLVGFTAGDKAVLAVVAGAGTGIFGGPAALDAVRVRLADAGYVLELVGDSAPAAPLTTPAGGTVQGGGR
ncbi:MAG: hypothetical protein JWM27_4858 [Gemmatimonadetes bacterium]|nr:hypothetical protein [Gemmatimonadota bacterium]